MDSNIQNVVIDTNVIVSAFLSSHDDVATVLVLNKLYKNVIRLYYSKEILVEYKDVLNREKFKFDKREINRFKAADNDTPYVGYIIYRLEERLKKF